MDNFLQSILASLSASLIVYIASKLFRKRKKPLKAATKSGWEFDLKIRFHKTK
ncbi:TPA: hypothetical protein KOU84_000206 [Clostridioides difficile]|nr:hypothetical protein [Clostridioides difficile]HBF7209786.1 hypothetical protein [Clostridioides difficile]